MAYNKKTWVSGDPLNPANMNHIEQGIYDCSATLENINGDGQGNLIVNGQEKAIITDNTQVQKIEIMCNNTLIGTRKSINITTPIFNNVANVSAVDDPINDRVNFTIGVDEVVHPSSHPGSMISLDTSSFDKNLDSSITNVQLLASKIDDMTFDISADTLRKLRSGGL